VHVIKFIIMVSSSARAAYSCKRLNSSTFLIVHDDKYEEHPYIYVKLYDEPRLAIVFDTGCGADAAAHDDARTTDLRTFIESTPVADNDNQPLNPSSIAASTITPQREYLVMCTHCHYDHIGGIESFPAERTYIVTSGNDKDFLARQSLDKNSLCKDVGMRTPSYTISHFTKDHEWISYKGTPLGLQALHTPGHSPDSLTVYDKNENWLFTGDSFYRRTCILPDGKHFNQPIIFPPQGDWTDFMATLDKLSIFVDKSDSERTSENKDEKKLRIACSHTTETAPAAALVLSVKQFFNSVLQGQVAVKERTSRNGETFAMWQDGEKPEFSLFAPERLKEEYLQKHKENKLPVAVNSQDGTHTAKSR